MRRRTRRKAGSAAVETAILAAVLTLALLAPPARVAAQLGRGVEHLVVRVRDAIGSPLP